MILSCQNISKSFGATDILKDISFILEEGEKGAIVGINGAGKTTLFNIITRNLEPDGGTLILPSDKTLGYLAQHASMDSELSLWDELLSAKKDVLSMESAMRRLEHEIANDPQNESLQNEYARISHMFESVNGYAIRSEATGILKGLGFCEEDFSRVMSTFSGGQKTRAALGKILFLKPDLLLLDEPTNHLDLNSITWLENYLANYRGALLLISHDRYFIDKAANKIIEIDNGFSAVYNMHYSDYQAAKEAKRTAALSAYTNQQKELKRQQEVIATLKSFNREKSIRRAESREKMLDKIDVLEKPTEVQNEMSLALSPRIKSGKDVLSVSGLSKSFGSLKLFENIEFEIKRGEHIALIGDNGTGKTTLLKILLELIPHDGNECMHIGSGVHIAYYDQEQQNLINENTLFDEVAHDFPELTVTQIRNALAAFLFTGDDAIKRVASLSGGERGRVSLLKLMLSKSNFLILDEPTNHLDSVSREALESAVNAYDGTLLYVSHDRYFINRTAHRVLELRDLKLYDYLGNYDDYTDKRNTESVPAPASSVKIVSESREEWQNTKAEQARMRKRKNDLEKTEQRISDIETDIKSLNERMLAPDICSNSVKLQELSTKTDRLNTELEQLYAEWEQLSL